MRENDLLGEDNQEISTRQERKGASAMNKKWIVWCLLTPCLCNLSYANDDIQSVPGGKITISSIPCLYQTRRVPTGRTIDGPGRDWNCGVISIPTIATYREYQDVKVELTKHQVCVQIGLNHGYGYDGDGWYWLRFYVGEKGPYALAYRIDKDYSEWFVDAIMNCSRKGGGCWTITVNKLRRDSSGKHWYIVANE